MLPDEKVLEQRFHQEDVLVGVVEKGFRNLRFRRRVVDFRRSLSNGQDPVRDGASNLGLLVNGGLGGRVVQDPDGGHLFLQSLAGKGRQKPEKVDQKRLSCELLKDRNRG